MHEHFALYFARTIWALTFASQLVLLVVLLGRDRVRRFPWFSASIALFAFRLMVEILLTNRISMIPLQTIFIVLADLTSLMSVLVVIEVARRAFSAARSRIWVLVSVAVVLVACAVVAFGGRWPQMQNLTVDSFIGLLRLMQFAAQKIEMLAEVLTVEACLLVVIFGRKFKAGWLSHTQSIAIGLGAVALATLSEQGYLQHLSSSVQITSRDQYNSLMKVVTWLVDGNQIFYIVVLIWWIFWLWRNEPGAAPEQKPAVEASEELQA